MGTIADRPVLKTAAAQLESDSVVVSDIVGPGGFLLVRAGSTLTPMMLERLRNFARLGEVREPLPVQRGINEP
jgi:hypothetical protein